MAYRQSPDELPRDGPGRRDRVPGANLLRCQEGRRRQPDRRVHPDQEEPDGERALCPARVLIVEGRGWAAGVEAEYCRRPHREAFLDHICDRRPDVMSVEEIVAN